MLKSKLKRVSIGQAIVHAARPRSSGLGIEMDSVFGSTWLVEELFRLGFSVSYDEVSQFKQSVLQRDDINNHIEVSTVLFSGLEIMLIIISQRHFMEWVSLLLQQL